MDTLPDDAVHAILHVRGVYMPNLARTNRRMHTLWNTPEHDLERHLHSHRRALVLGQIRERRLFEHPIERFVGFDREEWLSATKVEEWSIFSGCFESTLRRTYPGIFDPEDDFGVVP